MTKTEQEIIDYLVSIHGEYIRKEKENMIKRYKELEEKNERN